MARIEPLAVNELSHKTKLDLEYAEKLMGFIPNDVLTMAKWPAFLNATKQLVDVVYAPGALDSGLKRMIATVVSGAAGCVYCQAHTAHGAVKMAGEDAEKVKHVWEFESNPIFSEGEKAALSLAMAAGAQPNQARDEQFVELERHFSEQQIMEIMGMIALFGLLNRWNDTVKTELEPVPLSFAKENLKQSDSEAPG